MSHSVLLLYALCVHYSIKKGLCKCGEFEENNGGNQSGSPSAQGVTNDIGLACHHNKVILLLGICELSQRGHQRTGPTFAWMLEWTVQRRSEVDRRCSRWMTLSLRSIVSAEETYTLLP